MRCKVSIFHCKPFKLHMPLKRSGELTPIFSDINAGPASHKSLMLIKNQGNVQTQHSKK